MAQQQIFPRVRAVLLDFANGQSIKILAGTTASVPVSAGSLIRIWASGQIILRFAADESPTVLSQGLTAGPGDCIVGANSAEIWELAANASHLTISAPYADTVVSLTELERE